MHACVRNILVSKIQLCKNFFTIKKLLKIFASQSQQVAGSCENFLLCNQQHRKQSPIYFLRRCFLFSPNLRMNKKRFGDFLSPRKIGHFFLAQKSIGFFGFNLFRSKLQGINPN